MRTMIVDRAERLLNANDAIMTPLTPADRYFDGEQWHRPQNLAHDDPVHAVQHFGTHVSELGELIAIQSNTTANIIGQFQIMSISLIETLKLTETQVKALGFDTHGELLRKVGERRMWYMDVTLVTSAKTQ